MSDESDLKQLPTGKVGQLFRGLAYPFRGLSFISRHNLWGPCLWPIVINVLLFAALITLTVLYADDLRDLIWAKPMGEAWYDSLLRGLWHALHVLLLLLMLLVDVLAFALLGTVIAGPFLDVLSERTERILGIPMRGNGGVRAAVRSVSFALSDLVLILAFYVAVMLPLLLINIIPLVGSVVYAVLSTGFAMLMLALEFSSMPLNRRLVPFSAKWRTIWANKWLALGFGAAVFGVLFVPVLNMVLIPLAGVGGTLFFAELHAAGRLDEKALRIVDDHAA